MLNINDPICEAMTTYDYLIAAAALNATNNEDNLYQEVICLKSALLLLREKSLTLDLLWSLFFTKGKAPNLYSIVSTNACSACQQFLGRKSVLFNQEFME